MSKSRGGKAAKATKSQAAQPTISSFYKRRNAEKPSDVPPQPEGLAEIQEVSSELNASTDPGPSTGRKTQSAKPSRRLSRSNSLHGDTASRTEFLDNQQASTPQLHPRTEDIIVVNHASPTLSLPASQDTFSNASASNATKRLGNRNSRNSKSSRAPSRNHSFVSDVSTTKESSRSQESSKTHKPPLPQLSNVLSRNTSEIIIVDGAESPTQGRSKSKPITLDNSPLKVRSPIPRILMPLRKKRKIDYNQSPWPLSGEFQHIRGPQTLFDRPATILVPRSPRSSTSLYSETPSSIPTDDRQPDFLHEGEPLLPHTVIFPISDRIEALNSLLRPPDLDHAAIDRIAKDVRNSKASTQPECRPWTNKWRPLLADEVLGNDRSARYLRDWLKQLALEVEPPRTTPVTKSSSTLPLKQKRTKIIRTVDKKRRKIVDSDEEDDWIVADDDEEDDIGETIDHDDIDGNDDEEINMLPATSSPPASSLVDFPISFNGSSVLGDQQLESENDFAQHLTNTILLTGPPGSGKTASVYACAEELGWEVFEVYPGIGKRAGSNIMTMVGDLGKNHMVAKGAGKGGSKTAFSSWSIQEPGKQSSDQKNGNKLGSDAVWDDADPRFGFISSPSKQTRKPAAAAQAPAPAEDVPPSVRQSIILIEEADVLFKDDVNFWPAVVSLVKNSRRPVILTCNDATLIPHDDLPLQTTLDFVPCSLSLMTTYLQTIGIAEGYWVSSTSMSHLTASTFTLISPDNPETPHLVRDLPQLDLRRSINQLQLWIQHPDLASVVNGGRNNDLARESLGRRPPDIQLVGDWSVPHEISRSVVKLPSKLHAGDNFKHLQRTWRMVDSASYCLAYLERRPKDVLDVSAMWRMFSRWPARWLIQFICRQALNIDDGFEPSMDDETTGHGCLFKPQRPAESSTGLSFFNYDERLFLESLVQTRKWYEHGSDTSIHMRNGLEKRVPMMAVGAPPVSLWRGEAALRQALIGGLLDRYVPSTRGSIASRGGGDVVEFGAWLPVMFLADEADEERHEREAAALAAKMPTTLRMTRNSQMARQPEFIRRFLGLRVEERQLLRSRLVWVDSI